MMDQAICRGSWMLGSACGHCQRCLDEAGDVIPKLLRDHEELQARLIHVVSIIPPPFTDSNWDYADKFKAAAFDEVRRLIHRGRTLK